MKIAWNFQVCQFPPFIIGNLFVEITLSINCLGWPCFYSINVGHRMAVSPPPAFPLSSHGLPVLLHLLPVVLTSLMLFRLLKSLRPRLHCFHTFTGLSPSVFPLGFVHLSSIWDVWHISCLSEHCNSSAAQLLMGGNQEAVGGLKTGGGISPRLGV